MRRKRGGWDYTVRAVLTAQSAAASAGYLSSSGWLSAEDKEIPAQLMQAGPPFGCPACFTACFGT